MKFLVIFCGAHGSSQLGNARTFINFCKRKKCDRIADVLKEITNEYGSPIPRLILRQIKMRAKAFQIQSNKVLKRML